MEVVQNYFDVGSFDAKTYFAELLRNIAEGKTIRITKNGKPVAIMQSPQKAANTEALNAVRRLREIRDNIVSKSGSITVDEIKQLRDEGRKY